MSQPSATALSFSCEHVLGSGPSKDSCHSSDYLQYASYRFRVYEVIFLGDTRGLTCTKPGQVRVKALKKRKAHVHIPLR